MVTTVYRVGIERIHRALSKSDLLPSIVFRAARRQCDSDVVSAAKSRYMDLGSEEKKEIESNVRRIISEYSLDPAIIENHPHFLSLVRTGVGAHHAGQLLPWRLLLEELMTAGVLRILVATGTVAAGVDFPARTVVITSHTRRGADGFDVLSASEFQQMSGRAGRRGKDSVGFCVAAPSKFCDPQVLERIARRKPEALESKYFPSASSVLNLLRYRNADDLRYTVARSFASFLDHKKAEGYLEQIKMIEAHAEGGKEQAKKIKKLRRQATARQTRMTSLLEQALGGLGTLGYVEGDNLSEKGFWAANICTTLVLELAEVVDSGLIDNPTEEQLISIVAAMSGESHRQYLEIDTVEGPPKKELKQLEEILERIRSVEIPGTSEAAAVLDSAARTVLFWSRCRDWHEFQSHIRLFGAQDGDIARLVTQTAEHLNQLGRLIHSHPDIATCADAARSKILRPPLTDVIAKV